MRDLWTTDEDEVGKVGSKEARDKAGDIDWQRHMQGKKGISGF